AAGVAGAAAAAADAGWEMADLMTLDVGGTSADIGVIRGGRPVLSSEEHIADFPLLIPTIAVSSIGAGGGSILWLDPTGSLKVGPRSVGADPGPACYGTSGSRIPALTDAFLVAGLLAPGQRLGGKLPLQMQPAREALETLAGPLAMPVETVADGAIRVANALMAGEASNVLARRGVDAPRLRAAFHAAHRAAYSHANETAEIWLKELRAHIIGATPKPRIIPLRSEAGTASEATRTVRLFGREFSAGVHERAALGIDQRIAGPAIVNQMDTTTWIPEGWTAQVVPSGALVLERT